MKQGLNLLAVTNTLAYYNLVSKFYCRGMSLALPKNMRLGWKLNAVANTLAYNIFDLKLYARGVSPVCPSPAYKYDTRLELAPTH